MNKVIKYVAKKVVKSKRLREKYLDVHTVTKIGKNAYRITEAGIFNMYLFVGKDRALLVDTGLGITGLTEIINSITKLPLTVVATHGHFDAIGGAGQFDTVYVHKSDIKDAKFFNKYKIRNLAYKCLPTKKFLNLTEENLITSNGAFEKLPKYPQFDLGGRKIEVIHTPSHTRGSCCYVDSETGIIVTGDMMLPVTSMLMPHSTTIDQFSRSLEKIVDKLRSGENYGMIGYKPISYDYTCDLKDIIDEIGMYGNDYSRLVGFKVSDNKKRILVYYPAKTQRRKLSQRIKTLMLGF